MTSHAVTDTTYVYFSLEEVANMVNAIAVMTKALEGRRIRRITPPFQEPEYNALAYRCVDLEEKAKAGKSITIRIKKS